MNRRPIQASIRTHAGDGDEPSLSRQLRDARSQWASGVAIVAVNDEGDLEAITVTAFNVVSLDPPLVLVCVDEQAAILPMLLELQRFTVNVLPEAAQRTASTVANRMPLRDLPFAQEGDPTLDGALVSLVCRLQDAHPGGDHRILVGAVEQVLFGPDAPPLLYFGRDYRRLQ